MENQNNKNIIHLLLTFESIFTDTALALEERVPEPWLEADKISVFPEEGTGAIVPVVYYRPAFSRPRLQGTRSC